MSADSRRLREHRDAALVLGHLLGHAGSPQPGILAALTQRDRSALRLRRPLILNPNTLAGFPGLTLSTHHPVRVGGGGLVFHCTNTADNRIEYALKVARPSLLLGSSAPQEYREMSGEYARHVRLAHPNVVRVLAGTRLNIPADAENPHTLTSCPTMLMDWLPDPTPLGVYLVKSRPSHSTLVRLILQCLHGLSYIHDQGIVHWDLKADNLLVDKHGLLRITDLGNSVSRDSVPSEVRTSLWNLPEELRRLRSQNPNTPNTARRVTLDLQEGTTWHSPQIDLYMLGRELDRFLSPRAESPGAADLAVPDYDRSSALRFLQSAFPGSEAAAQFTLAFLRLVVSRLLAAAHEEGGPYYQTAQDVIAELENCTGLPLDAADAEDLQTHMAVHSGIPGRPAALRNDREVLTVLCPPIARLDRQSLVPHWRDVTAAVNTSLLDHATGTHALLLDCIRALFADRQCPFWRASIQKSDLHVVLFASFFQHAGTPAFADVIDLLDGMPAGGWQRGYRHAILGGDEAFRANQGPAVRALIDRDRQDIRRLVGRAWSQSEGMATDSFLEAARRLLTPDDTLGPRVLDRQHALCTRDYVQRSKIQILRSMLQGRFALARFDRALRMALGRSLGSLLPWDFEGFARTLTCEPHAIVDTPEGARAVGTIATTDSGRRVLEQVSFSEYCAAGLSADDGPGRSRRALEWHVIHWHLCGAHSAAHLDARYDEFKALCLTQSEPQIIATLLRRLAGDRASGEVRAWLREFDLHRSLMGDPTSRYEIVYRSPCGVSLNHLPWGRRYRSCPHVAADATLAQRLKAATQVSRAAANAVQRAWRAFPAARKALPFYPTVLVHPLYGTHSPPEGTGDPGRPAGGRDSLAECIDRQTRCAASASSLHVHQRLLRPLIETGLGREQLSDAIVVVAQESMVSSGRATV